MDSSSQVYFTTSDNSITSITPNPSVNTGEDASTSDPNIQFLVAAVSSVVIIVAISALVVYIKKKRTNK